MYATTAHPGAPPDWRSVPQGAHCGSGRSCSLPLRQTPKGSLSWRWSKTGSCSCSGEVYGGKEGKNRFFDITQLKKEREWCRVCHICQRKKITSVFLEILPHYQPLPLPLQKTHPHPVREGVKSNSWQRHLHLWLRDDGLTAELTFLRGLRVRGSSVGRGRVCWRASCSSGSGLLVASLSEAGSLLVNPKHKVPSSAGSCEL